MDDKPLTPDLCVIGAGAGGLTVAAGASQMGARTLLIERGAMGGDCLNTGCVPSKSLLAAAHAATAAAEAHRLGIGDGARPAVAYAGVRAHLRGVIEAIAPNDSVERFEGMGVQVMQASARFVDADTVEAGGRRIRARRFVIATGGRPWIPDLPGIDGVPCLTNETVFDLPDLPRHLVILGGGPIGAELGQAFRRLGSAVTLIDGARLLPREDPELAGVVAARLRGDGIVLHEGVAAARVGTADAGVGVTLADGTVAAGSHLLVATGRVADLDSLGLDAAGIEWTPRGVKVNARLQTGNRRVYALGDAVGLQPFTHAAGHHAGIVLRNVLFRWPARIEERAMPRAVYTEPELAQVGLTEAEARQRHRSIRILRWPIADNDRAQAERRPEGLVKVIVTPRGRILGCGIAGHAAGEQIGLWALAIARGHRIGAVAALVLPYPTYGEAGKRAAGSHFTASLFSERTRRVVRMLLRLP